MTEQSRRATSIESMGELMQPVITMEGVGHGLAFQPRPTDIIIAPFGKSGTTWLQQIVHGLRTRGDMDFDDISRVVPWIETAHDLGLDLDAEQKANPRAFKSHLDYTAVPKGCRYIVALRDPRDAMVSLYRFFENWFFEPGTISLEEFARGRYFLRGTDSPEGSDYWTHFQSWWAVRDEPNVLLMAYEKMKHDLPGTVEKVANLMELTMDDELRDIVLRQSSIEFMSAHKDRYDDLLMRRRSEQVLGLPPGSDSAKVRVGQVGSHRQELSDELVAEFDSIWRQTITPALGFDSYADALEQL